MTLCRQIMLRAYAPVYTEPISGHPTMAQQYNQTNVNLHCAPTASASPAWLPTRQPANLPNLPACLPACIDLLSATRSRLPNAECKMRKAQGGAGEAAMVYKQPRRRPSGTRQGCDMGMGGGPRGGEERRGEERLGRFGSRLHPFLIG